MVNKMNPRQGMICTILAAFHGERTVSAVFHLLKGKKSAQTIQDGSFFNVLCYFGIFPRFDRALFERDLDELTDAGDITYSDEKATLTEQGVNKLKEYHLKRQGLKKLNGWRYHMYNDKVWLRLCLYIQTLSYVVGEDRQFYPITHRLDIQQWVKRALPSSPSVRKARLTQLYQELYTFLSGCEEKEAMITVHQLSGTTKVGLTIQQLSDYLEMDVVDVYLCHLIALHKLYYELEHEEGRYPVLASMLTDLKQKVVLTESAKKTYELLSRGLSLIKISEVRKLKQNTIEDHIVEIVLQHPDFSIRPFIDERTEQVIRNKIEQLKTSRLRELKEQLPSDISYFMLRIVLAKKKEG